MIHPIHPGPSAIIPAAATTPQREVICLQHKENRLIFENHINMLDDALKSQVIDAINDTYLKEMRNKYTGYLGVTTRDLLDHLLNP
jgi:hypothetical protein